MPVTSVLEPVLEAVDWLISAGEVAWSVIEVGLMIYLIFGGGWLDMIRLISFWLDTLVIKYIDKFYSYFDKILANQIFAPDVVDGVMKRVYIFVSLLVLIKLMMLFMKYIANPELVSDEKLGASSLIRRVVLGMCGMLFLPTIFDLGIGIQKAVLSDNLFGKILLDESQIKEFEKDKNRVGRILAFNVYQAFWNIDRSQVTDRGIIDKYEKANAAYDPSAMGGLFSINEKNGDTYAIDYFPIASSVVLVYVLYLVIKYCLDVVVRLFKLFLLQMIGPLAISDYMINGDSKDVFKNWLRTTLSVYAMLFVRIFSIWFIAFVTQLMKSSCTSALEDGICPDSLLYMGAEPDYLLRGIITLGLLALLMDLPKFFSDILGLDLEQDASVKGIMQKAGGALKGAAVGGLAVGGAAIGGAIGGAKNLASAGKNLAGNVIGNKAKLGEKMKTDKGLASAHANMMDKKNALKDLKKNGGTKEQIDAAKNDLKNAKKDLNNTSAMKEYKAANQHAAAKATGQFATGLGGAAHGALAGIMAATPGLKEVSGGYNQGKGAVNSQDQERNKSHDEQKGVSDSYKKGIEAAIADGKTMSEHEQLVTQVVKTELDAAQEAGKIKATAEIQGVESNGASATIGAKAMVDSVESNGASATISAKAKVDSVETSGASATISAKAKVDEVDTSGASATIGAKAKVDEVDSGGATMHVDTKVDESGISKNGSSVTEEVVEKKVTTTGDTSTGVEDASAELNLTIKKKKEEKEYSVFDDPSNFEHIDG